MTAVPPAKDDLDNRSPVWDALSSLFLDTDTSLSRGWRVKLLASSLYSLEQLETILVDEVYPICRWNLFNIAGEWAAFDMVWLEKRILRRLQSLLRFLHRVNLGRVTVLLSGEWAATKREVAVSGMRERGKLKGAGRRREKRIRPHCEREHAARLVNQQPVRSARS